MTADDSALRQRINDLCEQAELLATIHGPTTTGHPRDAAVWVIDLRAAITATTTTEPPAGDPPT